MTRNLTTICIALLGTPLWADPVMLTGAIGPYDIEMELDHDAQGTINGRYRYEGRDTWLGLTGEAHGQSALSLDEMADGTHTGVFYLERQSSGLIGYWVGAGTADEQGPDFKVALQTSMDARDIFPPAAPIEVNQLLTGRYSVADYWVNDWFSPNYEIGFNGGEVNVVELTEDEILVQFQFVVGPTYHIASFQGIADRVSEGMFVHDAVLAGGSDPCRLEFTFDATGLSISDVGNGYACQFGARAHANFDLPKVSDIAEFGGNW